MLRRVLALLRRHPVLAGCLLLGLAIVGLRLRLRPDLLAQVSDELTPEQLRVLYLRFVADLDTSSIARDLGQPEDVVRALQLDALRNLLRVLADRRR